MCSFSPKAGENGAGATDFFKDVSCSCASNGEIESATSAKKRKMCFMIRLMQLSVARKGKRAKSNHAQQVTWKRHHYRLMLCENVNHIFVFLLTGISHALILHIQIRGTWKRHTDRVRD